MIKIIEGKSNKKVEFRFGQSKKSTFFNTNFYFHFLEKVLKWKLLLDFSLEFSFKINQHISFLVRVQEHITIEESKFKIM